MLTIENNKMAVLIDAENISHNDINVIFNELKTMGNIVIKRAYGGIKKIAEWEKVCIENAITVTTQFNNVKSKNVADFSLVIEAMDILYTRDIDCFVIVSSDSDYTGLISRIKENNKTVIGVGRQQTPVSLRNACNDFIFIENLKNQGHVALEATEDTIKENNITKLSKINKYIKKIVLATENNTLPMSRIQELIKNQYPDFDYRSYGCKKLSELVKKIPGVTIDILDDKTTMMVRFDTDEENKPEPIKPKKDEKVVISYKGEWNPTNDKESLKEYKYSSDPDIEDKLTKYSEESSSKYEKLKEDLLSGVDAEDIFPNPLQEYYDKQLEAKIEEINKPSIPSKAELVEYLYILFEEKDKYNIGELQTLLRKHFSSFSVKAYKVATFIKLLKSLDISLSYDSEEKPNYVSLLKN